jgi:hypothetical protein
MTFLYQLLSCYTNYSTVNTSVSDPHRFLSGSGASLLSECGSGSGTRFKINVDPYTFPWCTVEKDFFHFETNETLPFNENKVTFTHVNTGTVPIALY